jgi:hypothetical protein
MMNLLNYAPFWRGEGQGGKDHEGEVLHSEACRGRKVRGDEIRPTGKAFDVILTGGRAVSVWDIGDED